VGPIEAGEITEATATTAGTEATEAMETTVVMETAETIEKKMIMTNSFCQRESGQPAKMA
jgi:hypothetical protein